MKRLAKTWKSLFTVCFIVGLVGCVKNEPCETLPKGYIIVTDGEKYRWRNSKITSGFDRDNKEEAIKAACRYNKSWGRDEQAESWPEAD